MTWMAAGAWHHTAELKSATINLAKIVMGLVSSKADTKMIEAVDCHPYHGRTPLMRLNEEYATELKKIRDKPYAERAEARERLNRRYAEEREKIGQ